EELPPALDLYALWCTAVPVTFELLDAQGRKPFSRTALACKGDQLRDLGVVDARHVDRRDEEVHGTFCDRPCCAGHLFDIVPVHPGKITGERRVERVDREVDPVEPCIRERCDLPVVKERAVCLERDDRDGIDRLECRDQLGEPGVHEWLTRGI